MILLLFRIEMAIGERLLVRNGYVVTQDGVSRHDSISLFSSCVWGIRMNVFEIR